MLNNELTDPNLQQFNKHTYKHNLTAQADNNTTRYYLLYQIHMLETVKSKMSCTNHATTSQQY